MTSEDGAGHHPAGKLWGGRFAKASDPALERLSRSPDAAFGLLPEDVQGAIAHAGALARAGLLRDDEQLALVAALEAIADGYAAGRVRPASQDEDVQGFLERELTDRVGPLAGKLRAGRSRNDQAANDLRLYLRRTIPEIAGLVADLVDALCDRSQDADGAVAPGFTHLQPAQPILFAHQLLAHGSALARDLVRLRHAWEASGRSALGAAALAGTAIHGSSELVAAELGYDGVAANSIDAVSSRDHVADYLYAAAMLGVDLSRLCEEVCLWASAQFGWIELDDAFSTGSSIMPQKKNPDVAELTRGRAGRLVANLTGLLITLKGLPFAYNRDLAEDKRYVFDTTEALEEALPALTGTVRTLHLRPSVMREQATRGFTLATELADWLAEQGVPFSEAHDITGQVVHECERRGLALEQMTAAELAAVDPRITPAARERLTLESAIARRAAPGGTAATNLPAQRRELHDAVADLWTWIDRADAKR